MDRQLTDITVSGATYDEALEAGLQVLGISKDMVDIEEIPHNDDDLLPNAEPLEGITLRLRPRIQDIVASAKTHLTKILELMGIKAHIEKLHRPRGTVLNILAKEDNALIIGKQGQNLEALQYLINRIATCGGSLGDSQAVIVDSEGYYEKHFARMEEIAQRAAKRILRDDRVMEVSLPPMSPNDRRLIHLILRDTRGVHTISRGEGPTRHVVVTGDRMEIIGSPLASTRYTKVTMDAGSLPPAVSIPEPSETPVVHHQDSKARDKDGQRKGGHRRHRGRRGRGSKPGHQNEGGTSQNSSNNDA